MQLVRKYFYPAYYCDDVGIIHRGRNEERKTPKAVILKFPVFLFADATVLAVPDLQGFSN